MQLREIEKSTKVALLIGGFFIVGAPSTETSGAMWTTMGIGGLIIVAAIYSELEGDNISEIADIQSSKGDGRKYTVSDLQNMSPSDFEMKVKSAWENAGYNTEMTPDGPDDGVDIFADNGNEYIAIQAKKYTKGNKVGGPIVRKSVGAADQSGADRVIVVTSSDFTDPAYTAAQEMSTDVELVNGEGLSRMLSS